MTAESQYWKPDRGERIANFTALAAGFQEHFNKALANDDEKRQRIAMAEMARRG